MRFSPLGLYYGFEYAGTVIFVSIGALQVRQKPARHIPLSNGRPQFAPWGNQSRRTDSPSHKVRHRPRISFSCP